MVQAVLNLEQCMPNKNTINRHNTVLCSQVQSAQVCDKLVCILQEQLKILFSHNVYQ